MPPAAPAEDEGEREAPKSIQYPSTAEPPRTVFIYIFAPVFVFAALLWSLTSPLKNSSSWRT